MNCFKKVRGVVALLLSVVFVVCALGSYQDVRADGPSDTVAIYNADKDGANIGIIGKGYAPNTTFKVTVTFSATVNISSSWNGSVTSDGSTVTFTVTTDGNGEYNVGMYMTGNYEGLSVLSKSSTGSAPKAEPAKPAPEKKDPEQEKPAPEPPADKPEDKKPGEKKPEEKKPEEKKPEEKEPEEKKAEEKKAEENKPDPEKNVEEEKTPAKQEDKNGNKDTKKDDSKASGDQAKADDKSSAATAAVSAGTTDKTKDTDAVSEPVEEESKEEKNAVTGEEGPAENEVQDEAFTEEGDAKDEEEIPVTSDDDGTKKDDKAPAAVKNEEGENEGEVTEEPTPELLSKTSVSGVIRADTKKKSGGWWTFLLILVIIGVCVRFAKMKMDGVDNSDLLKEFIPVKAIRNRFGSSKTPVPEAEAPVTVNGYLKKSDTASIRPVYSNTASGSASRVRGEAKTGTNKTAFNQAQAMKELHAMREGNDGGAKAPGQE